MGAQHSARATSPFVPGRTHGMLMLPCVSCAAGGGSATRAVLLVLADGARVCGTTL